MPKTDHDETEPSPPRGRRGLLAALRGIWQSPFRRFVLLFCLYLGAAGLAYPELRFRAPGFVQWASEQTSQIVYWMMLPFTNDVSQSGKMVSFYGFSVTIIEECIGVYEMLIFTTGVLAFPASPRSRTLGLLMGLPLLYLINVFRILMLVVVGHYAPEQFDFMHLYFWQATLILMITGVWLLWLYAIVRNDPKSLPHRA